MLLYNRYFDIRSIVRIFLLHSINREAHGYYTTAADTLRQTGDWLWLANCLEGLAAIAVLVHYPGIQRPTGLRRNSSLQARLRPFHWGFKNFLHGASNMPSMPSS